MKNKNTRINILIVVCVALILYFVLNSFRSGPITTTHDLFLSQVVYIDEVVVAGDGRTLVYKIDGRAYQTVLPLNDTTTIDRLIERDISVSIQPPPRPPNLLLTLLVMTVPVLLLIAALIWLANKNSKLPMSAGNPARLISPSENTTKLDDVAGNPGDFDEVKEIVDFLHSPKKYRDAGATLPKGVLMYGPPGVGKTMLAKAIANEAGVPFFYISGSEFVEMFVGVGAKRVRTMFSEIKKSAPALLFIDEIDALGSKRTVGAGTGSTREHDQTLNQLLVEMDGMCENTNIIVIAATNRPDTLDSALLRPGRFDRMIPINLPDINARQKILETYGRKKKIAIDIDMSAIAKSTPGFSGADLCNLINEAAMFAARDHRVSIELADLENAKDRILMGREKSLAMDKEEIRLTAYHEAGHAIVGFFEETHDPVYKISIVPRGLALGVTMYLPEKDKYSSSQTELVGHLRSLMGGRAAEELVFGEANITTGASNDIARATKLARDMVTKWGYGRMGIINLEMDGERSFVISEHTKHEVDKEVASLINEAYEYALYCLKENRDKLTIVAERLIDKETIDGKEFEEIMK